MNYEILALIITGIVSAVASFFIATTIHNRKLKEHKNIKSAIENTNNKLLEKKKSLKQLHARYEADAKKATEKIVEINGHVKKRQQEVDEKLRELKVKKDEYDNKIRYINDAIIQKEEYLNQKKGELFVVEERTKELVALEGRSNDIERLLIDNTNKNKSLTSELESIEDELQVLKSQLDLYTRIEDFVGYGVFETPEYLYETPDRYQAEIRQMREKQKSLIKNNDAVDLVSNIEVNGSTKSGKAVLNGQSRLMLRAFNIECDILFGKLNPSNFDRTLERIEKIAEGLEKTTISIANGISLEYIEFKFQECRLLFEYKLRKAEQDEEQRLIREQIREEQKAKKEFEKAVREAEKEERLYRDLLEKAREQLKDAHDTEKGELESNIKILEMQLEDALEKEQRAKSLAEQTRRGHVYVISNIGSFGEDIYKIGLTRRLEPLDRVKELGDASVPFLFDVHAIIYSDDAPSMETSLHRKFNHLRVNAVNRRKEFFRVSLEEIKNAVTEISSHEADFKMTALAEEYYESLRLQGNEV